MLIGTKIDLQITGDNKTGYFIEYKIGEGEWIRRTENPYYTYAGAAVALMNLREKVRYGLNQSLKVLFGLKDENT